MKQIDKYNLEVQELEKERQIINSKKRELWEKIAKIKRKITIYKIRQKYNGK